MRLTRKFVHSPVFEREWRLCGLGDDDLRDLQTTLLDNPKAGDVMQKNR